MKLRPQRIEFAKMLGSAVLSQALLSAASLAVGLLLIRHISDLQYGYYILAWNVVLLVVALHSAFVNPPMVQRLTPLDRRERGELVGGLYRDQTNVLTINAALVFAVCAALWYAGVFDKHTGPLLLVTVSVVFASLQRNFFRIVLLAHRRPHDVLRTDIFYIALLIAGAYLAIRTDFPATATLAAMCIAAAVSALFAARALRSYQPWNNRGAPGILRAIAPVAALSTAGAAIHWAFSQGYMYVAAGMLDVTAVAAIAGTRLLMMPINLLSTGIGTLMLPMTAEWLQREGAGFALRRLSLFALGMAGVSLCYFIVLWLTRDWIFAEVLKKQFVHRDQLLLLWSLAFLPMVIRDQLLYLLVARQRFRQLTSLVFVCAVVSLFAGYLGMRQFGVVGAPLGVLVGELLSLSGIVILSVRQLSGAAVSRSLAAEVT